ncbi:uncharacterized protein LOC124411344 [Diprion similis]|uniref:uncharacterized protein LOC124411344 n=1 Tax=Diprion similis TaxID=362088 RepID=UPI001EF7D576|nr:uncharacterized protein LOC124411344 [Diprion similis]
MSKILRIDASPVYNNGINQVIVHVHNPYANSFYNNNDEIRILIQQQNLCVLRSESIIYIQGKSFKIVACARNYPIDSELEKNFRCVFFDEIRYELNGVEIDRCKNVGITSTLKNYISLDQSKKNAMEIFGWKDEDYKKIVANARHELILIRNRTDKNCYKTSAAAEDMRLEITKLQWRIPHVMPSDVEKLSLLRILEKNQPIQMCFRSWSLHEYPNLPKSKMQVWPIKIATQLEKPRYVIFALQRNRKENVKNHASYFDHCDLRNVKLFLNSDSYPYENLNVSCKNEQFALLYDMYAKFQNSYYGIENRPILDMQTYIKDAPIMVIGCSRQNESIKSATVDIRIEFVSETDIENGTAAYRLILHDRIVEYTPLTNVVRKLL